MTSPNDANLRIAGLLGEPGMPAPDVVGLDAIDFTGGIGENDAKVRAAICDGLQWAGVEIDEARNPPARNPISTAGARCSVQVLDSQEGEQIAAHAWALCPSPSS